MPAPNRCPTLSSRPRGRSLVRGTEHQPNRPDEVVSRSLSDNRATIDALVGNAPHCLAGAKRRRTRRDEPRSDAVPGLHIRTAIAVISRKRMCALLAAGPLVPRPSGAQTAPVVRLASETSETYGEFLYGLDGGFFNRAGLNVEMTLLPSAGAITTALAGGAVDVGLTDALVLANTFNRGLPLVAVAGSGLFRTSDPSSALCVAKNSPVVNARGFEGQTIALNTLVSLASMGIKMWLARNGANAAAVHFVEMPVSEMPAALERGTVVGAYVTEPQLSQARADLRIVAIPYSAIADRFLISLVVTTRDWIARNAETAKRVVTATYATARWANQNRDLTAPILAKYSKLEPDVIRHMQRSLFATTLEPRLVQPVLDTAFTYKAIDRPTAAANLMLRV